MSKDEKRELRERTFSLHAAVGAISRVSQRRIFLISDPIDSYAPFRQQIQYAELLQRVGQRVRLIEARAPPYGDGHAFSRESLFRAAARCLKGENDAQIAKVFGGILRVP